MIANVYAIQSLSTSLFSRAKKTKVDTHKLTYFPS